MIHPEIARHIPDIRMLCREFGVSKLEVFGSPVTNAFDPNRSDIDLLVEYPDHYDFGHFGNRLFQFEERLASIVGRDVDVVINKSHRNRFFARDIDRTRRVIYVAAGRSGEVATPCTERTGAANSAITPPAHQRTLKLLEDIRLSCVDVEALAKDLTTKASLPDQVMRDASAWSIQKTGMSCKRLDEADAEITSQIAHLAAIIDLSNQLAYGSDVQVDSAKLYNAITSLIPEVRKEVTALIGRLEHGEQAAFG